MGITNFDTVKAGLGASLRADPTKRYTYDNFNSRPLFADEDGDGAPTGAAGDENIMLTADNGFEYHIIGTQTIVKPTWSSTGVDISLDQTDNEGCEISQGITTASKAAFTVGTDGAFFARCKFAVADVSGTDDCAFGFRKVEANQAAIDDYDEMAVLNLISGTVNIETILNGGATTTTSTTDTVADTVEVTFEVRVSDTGVVTYLIDGVAPTVTAAFTFDDAEVVIPFFYFIHATDVAGTVELREWEVGLNTARGLVAQDDLTN